MRASRRIVEIACLMAIALVFTVVSAAFAVPASRWSTRERETLRSLTLAQLPALSADASNRYADDARAAALGHRLFFDTRFSGTGKVSCATCHDPATQFQDAKPLAVGVDTAARRTMPVAGTAHSPWQFWDGRADSQWAQALGPLESAVEHGGNRTQYLRLVASHYRREYERVFGPLPELTGLPRHAGPVDNPEWRGAWETLTAGRRDAISRVYANIGKAIAAYERQLTFAPSRFDRYVQVELKGTPHTPLSAFTRDEEAGLRLFIGKGNCINCHNGALLTDDHFHNTGVAVSPAVATPDSGRAVGARQALTGEFSCVSRYSDAGADQCDELRFAVTEGEELVRAYKTPSLRNVAERAPYMHAGQITSLESAIAHYNAAPRAPFGHSELSPLRLTVTEQRQLAAFLKTLSGPIAAPPGFLNDPHTQR